MNFLTKATFVIMKVFMLIIALYGEKKLLQGRNKFYWKIRLAEGNTI